uniref:Uncharacterized protein n=1 Tax=Candidatus Kentrum eta TaxID=2126337 RepID=A0A450VH37_9GAMM|nr:MAG: hypothetical protein BECKH772B_GA0070898_103893 [Candidatus Kentron sp. H]VFK04119.1 MAG: hypothetical protein BECKH772A_GA0070896_103833 [Candidatus Kentron sp. H]VFK06978.1 MAG: hypothetical protein BECKH772C_GA0070978_103873 [Candidatus Kentron sp. H]
MWRDPIVEEIHKIREEHAARFNYDLEAIYQDLKRLERASGRETVTFAPKRVREGSDAGIRKPISLIE